MNVGLAMFISLCALLLAYRFYGRRVAKWAGVDSERPTPAHTVNDGVDYVPAKPSVLLGHHFASIAAAGPIVGPTLAIVYGYVPTWLWIVLGVTFIGAVHDFMSLFVSIREGGKSIAEIARRTLGKTGFLLFVSFAILLSILVGAAFLQLTAVALTSLYPISDFGLDHSQTILHTVTENGVAKGLVGGIASTSVIIMTLFAPLLGFLLYRRNIGVIMASGIALAVGLLSVWIGFLFPLRIDPVHWMIIICIYTLFAARIPVWIVLQPRDFVNVQFLYIGLITMIVGIIGCGFAGVVLDAPAFNLTDGYNALGLMWPFLFITVACGSVSGAHALIGSGTTSKQVSNEKHAPMIGYGGMLLEALLGICVTLIILGGLGFVDYHTLVWEEGNAPLAFAAGVGKTLEKGLGIQSVYGTIFGILLLEGFLVTTVDTIVRLTRYLFEELWQNLLPRTPRILKNKMVNTLIPVAGMALLGFTNAYTTIWPIFGSANQMLAALTLIAVTAWLVQKSKNSWFTAIPAIFMVITTLTSLSLLGYKYITQSGNLLLTITDLVLLALCLSVIFITFRYFYRLRAGLSSPMD